VKVCDQIAFHFLWVSFFSHTLWPGRPRWTVNATDWFWLFLPPLNLVDQLLSSTFSYLAVQVWT
jgi:hypothetical protein